MKTKSKMFLLAPAWPLPLPDSSSLNFPRVASSTLLASQPAPSEDWLPEPNNASASAPEIVEPPSIYVVDDEPRLTELYTIVLESAGYRVQPFTDRFEALAAFERNQKKPDLLIVDYFGSAMLAERFMYRCRFAHRKLRILMASGLSEIDMHFFLVRPNRFIQKPFTGEEFLREVRAVLAADPGDSL